MIWLPPWVSMAFSVCKQWPSQLPSDTWWGASMAVFYTGLNNKLSFHMASLPFSSLSPLPWYSADIAIGAWDPNKVRSGAVMSWYPVSAVRPETDPFWKNRRWERKRGACGVNERDHTAHIRQDLKPYPETEPHAAALRFTREGETFSADEMLL